MRSIPLAVAPGGERCKSGRRSRYPAISPDGQWLAYSAQEDGAWHLQAMKLATSEQHRLTHGDCNAVMPAWTSDSKTIVYATDCGRNIGDTALCRIGIVP